MSTYAIDFLQTRKPRWIGWCLFVAGLAALVASLWLEQRWTASRTQREAVARSRAEAAQEARRVALRPVPLSADERRLWKVAGQLRQPWLPSLRVIENVTEAPVYLVGLSIDPATGTVRLDGEAPTFDHALVYMQSLDEVGLIGPAELRSHEVVAEAATGRSALRFTIVTRWAR